MKALKFLKLVKVVKTLGIDSFDKLTKITELLFKKGVEGPGFATASANFCQCLVLLRIPNENNENEIVNVKLLLIMKCHLETLKNTADEQAKSQLLRDIETAETLKMKVESKLKYLSLKQKAKRSFLGNERFIRELFGRNLIPEYFMHYFLTILLAERGEDLLHRVCCIFITVGKALDTGKPQKENVMDSYFNQMREIVNKRKITPWLLAKMNYVIDLRQYKWVHRNERKSCSFTRQSAQVAVQKSQERSLEQPTTSQTRPNAWDKRIKENDSANQGKVEQSQAMSSTLGVKCSRCVSKVTLSMSEMELVEIPEDGEMCKEASSTTREGCVTSPYTELTVVDQSASELCRCKQSFKADTKCQCLSQTEGAIQEQRAGSSHLKPQHDRLELFGDYMADLLKDVAINERRKCQADVLKVVNGYADRCIVKVEIYVNKE